MPSHAVKELGRGLGKTLLFDLTCRISNIPIKYTYLAHRFLLTKLEELDGDANPYLAIIMVTTLAQVGEALVMLEDTQIMMITKEAFNNILLKGAGYNYDSYNLISR